MAIDIVGLGTVAAAFFVAAASPGPATIAVASVSIRSGRAYGLRFGLGLSVGLAFWGLIAGTGLGAVLQASSSVLTALKLCGGAYLLWLAYGAARSATHVAPTTADVAAKGRPFTTGLLLNLSNPKAVLAWMAALTLGLANGSGAGQVIAATAICIVLGYLTYASYAVIFSTSGAMQIYQRIRRWIDGTVAGLFAMAGIGLIRSAFVRQ